MNTAAPNLVRGQWKTTLVLGAAIIVATVVVLFLMGRVWWCGCRAPSPWISDIWSKHCSQHFFDPYTFSHISHGLLFFVGMEMLTRLLPGHLASRFTIPRRFLFALALEAGWEILENTPIVIDRYRSVTISLDYNGDSILNSIGDIVSCALGFLLAWRIGIRGALAVFFAFELMTLVWIRDNLTLNIVMLLYPLDAIKGWQTPAALQ